LAFNDIIRNGVAIADRLTKDLQAIVTHEAWVGQTGSGRSMYGPPINRKAIVDTRVRDRVTNAGQTVTTRASIQFLEAIEPNGAIGRVEPIDPRDRITLPDGTSGPIVDIGGFIDGQTNRPYTSEVWIGLGGVR
jgi:hypothetical protein